MTTCNSIYAVYGASGFGREVMPLVRKIYNNIGTSFLFVDDNEKIKYINGYDVMKYDYFLKLKKMKKNIVIAIANSEIRKSLAEKCISDGIKLINVYSETSIIMDNVSIGEGAVLCHYVTLTSNIRIGSSFHANIYSYVGHDCVIGDYVTFAPAVKCNGNVVIEDHVYVGTGAIIKQGKPGKPLIIGKGSVIGMGALINKNVPAGTMVVSNKSRLIERKMLGW